MAHFARLNSSNIVTEVVVVANPVLLNEDGNESEALGIEFLRAHYNDPNAIFVQTSYNGNIRKNYAGAGYRYDPVRDAFIPPKPYSSWVINMDTCKWEAPVPYPDDGKIYDWSEDTLSWIERV